MLAALVLVALVPAGCVLWFMTVAMRNERLAVQERLTEVYHTHLTALQRQVTAFWQAKQAVLTATGHESPAEMFAASVRAEVADSVVVCDSAGKVLYPSALNEELRSEEDGDWAPARELEFQRKDYVAAAQAYGRIADLWPGSATPATTVRACALQAQAGCLLKAGEREAVLNLLAQLASDPGLRDAVSAQGTLIGPNAQLLILKMLGKSADGSSEVGPALRAGLSSNEIRSQSPGPLGERAPPSLRQRTLDDLVGRLNDYSGTAMPSSQRRFLMHELMALAPAGVVFPSLAAEDLAGDFVEREPARPPEANNLALGTEAPATTVGAALRRDSDDPSRHKAAPTTDQVEPGFEVSGPTRTTLQRTPLARVWSLPSADRTLVALYREERLKSELNAWLAPLALPDVHVTVLPPGETSAPHKRAPSLDAGEFMPGWRLALSFNGTDPLTSASTRQSRIYIWIGFLVVLIIALLAFMVARFVSAQMRLARLRDELVSTVSHELKTPLASMRALVDTLAAGRFHDEQQLREYLQLLGNENLRLSHLIENFLAFSRMERGQQRFHFESLAPAAVVGEAVAVLKEKLEAPHCRFELQARPDLPRIRGDAEALATILVNLLDNACKYTNGDKHIAARAYAENGDVWFEVEDNGIGLTPAESRKIFDRFYQVDQSLTRQRGGCGLGLSIVKFIVEAHHGTVEVRSEPGKGSTFRVRIPIAETTFSRERTHGAQR